ncbi:sensor histidine kinase [Pontibacter toksunensis]|uniref:Sensor histidine kinase n=1 Tax=Pontibacter toksunensis TaxID=1332631 RepID=A0ABW6C279_9BACT
MVKAISFSCIYLFMGSFLVYLLYSLGGKPMLANLSPSQWIMLLLVTFSVSLFITAGYFYLAYRFTWRKSVQVRLGLTFLLLWASTVSAAYFIVLQSGAWGLSTDLSVSENRTLFMLKGAIVGLVLSLFIVWGDFSLFVYNRYSSETLVELQAARKQKELQFQILRSQLTPHFLFNSLNTASNLTGTRPQQAEGFLRKLALNYNHLLQYAGSPLNSLEKELEIMDNFFHLMQIRFGQKIMLEKRINPTCLSNKLPALSLQLLVENALKHNVATAENQMKIVITADTEQVVVVNNKTVTPARVASHGIGLKNLQAHYSHFSNSQLRVSQSKTHYQVILPYIQGSERKNDV